MKTINYHVVSEEGLHARPASIMSQIAAKYPDTVDIVYNGRQLTMKSIMAVMSLGIPHGAEFSIVIDGENELAIQAELEQLLKDNNII